MPPNKVKQRAFRIQNGTATFEDRFVPDHEELVQLIDEIRAAGSVVVFTTGVWDLFHIGHGDYIQAGKDEAAKLYPNADRIIMVVGVDTDKLTKERKGPKRPIVPEEERYKVLGHLRCVDIITPQYEANQLYQIISHDVRVISTSTKDLPPDHDQIKARCAHLVNLPPQAETSTSARIRILSMDGGHDAVTKIRDRLVGVLDTFQQELMEVGDDPPK